MKDLSPAMAKAIFSANPGGAILEANSKTEAALIRRGLADPITGTTTRRNRTSHFAQTVYDAYLGARLNNKGREVQAQLIADAKLVITREFRHDDDTEPGGPDTPGGDCLTYADGAPIGGTYWCGSDDVPAGQRWASWGPAGLSMGHRTREDAEGAQLAVHLARQV